MAIPGTSRVSENKQTLRTNNDRYWLRGMADGFLGASTWRYRSNIDYVSDQDFFVSSTKGLQVLTGPVTICSGCLGVICRKTIKTA